jgi:hypothetical protein
MSATVLFFGGYQATQTDIANDKVVTDIASGYAQCRANLKWM